MSKWLKEDPYWEREKEKYENPIPSREFIMQILENLGKPATRRSLIKFFDLETEDQKEAFRRRLRAMERDGQLISNRKDQYALVNQLELVRGRVLGRKEGYGFIIPDNSTDDVYLSPYQMRAVFPNDVVLARISGFDSRGRREGNIVEVLERHTQQVVGYYREEGGVSFVEPEQKNTQQNILISSDERHGAKDGQIVVAVIVAQPTKKRQATGKIIEILGDHMAPGLEIEVAIRSYELPYEWSKEVLKDVKKIEQVVPEKTIAGRKDLRRLPFVTIDGEDAKDFDDAVFCERINKGTWRLFVAIADVSYYVKPDTLLDKEAALRGNSVYFPDRVIPMLPEALSNGICSLKARQDRLCLICEMTVTDKGILSDYHFYEGVIHSHARLTYTEVEAILQGEKTKHVDLVPHLKNLNKLYRQLHAQRLQRGALDFDSIETRIIFGKNRKISKIIPVERTDAHRLIEECMLLANVSAARFLKQHHMLLLYRVHRGPDPDKLENLTTFLNGLGLKLGGKNSPTPKDYAILLHHIKDREDAHIIQMMLLRSLKQAIYAPINEGHFGLAYEHYCHFTSPIRRYPDTLVHRAIRHILEKKKPEAFFYDHARMMTFADHCSMTERRADEATRDVVDWLKCEFMLDKLGMEYDGIISEVTGFGVFVELKNIYVEGLVHITALKNDYYHFDPIRRCLIGKRSGLIYRIGDIMRVKVVRVDLDQKRIDFDILTKTTATKKKVRKITKKNKKTRKAKKTKK